MVRKVDYKDAEEDEEIEEDDDEEDFEDDDEEPEQQVKQVKKAINKPSSAPEKERQKVILVPRCVTQEEMFNIIYDKLLAIEGKLNE